MEVLRVRNGTFLSLNTALVVLVSHQLVSDEFNITYLFRIDDGQIYRLPGRVKLLAIWLVLEDKLPRLPESGRRDECEGLV